MSDLKGSSDALSEVAKMRQQQKDKLNQQLGEPARFIADKHDARFGIGFWRGDNGSGVISYRKYANGYDPFSRVEYPRDLIDLLVNVQDGD